MHCDVSQGAYNEIHNVTSNATQHYLTTVSSTLCSPQLAVRHHLTTQKCSEKYVIGQFHHFECIVDCTTTNIDNIANYTPRLYSIA